MKKGKTVFIIESEEDVETLRNMDPKPDIVIRKPDPESVPEDYTEPEIFLVFLGAVEMILKLVVFSLTSFTIISVVWYLFTCQHRKLLESSMKEKYTAD